MRRTKIVATMGPSLTTYQSIEALIKAGADVVRLNFSHGNAEEHIDRAKKVRRAAKKLKRTVSILGDLQGPKIRIDRFKNGEIDLKIGEHFLLDTAMNPNAGTQKAVGLTYKDLPNDVFCGDELLLDDGRIELRVNKTAGSKIYTTVIHGGKLSNNKGINRRGGGLSAAALTAKDLEDIKLAAKMDVDYLAVSFPRSAADLEYARDLMTQAGGDACIVAKIERAEAVEDEQTLNDIIRTSDIIMIARGDLGVEIGDAKLPAMQKKLIKRSREMDKPVITATQMMESMIDNPIPTRAEVFDVANAVMDGTDAVMLSGETAIGKHPAKVVEVMGRICEEAELADQTKKSRHRIHQTFKQIDEAIALASMYAANHLGVKGIVALTESGATALWMSRISSPITIYALTNHKKTCRCVNIYRGVHPVYLKEKLKDPKIANRIAIEHLLKDNIVSNGDLVIVTKGDLMGKNGGTNMLKIIRVGEHHNG